MMFAIILCIITLAIYKTDFVYESFDDEDNAFEFYHLLPFAANSAIKISSRHYRTNLQTLTMCVYKDCKISELIFESGRGTLISGLFGRTYLEEGQKEGGGGES